MTEQPTVSDALRIALVGYGRWGAHVARDLAFCGVRVVAVCRGDESAARAQTSEDVHEVVRSIDDLREVEGVVVCTPTPVHSESLNAVATLDVPMFVEKPIANDVEATRQLVDAYGDRLFVMDKWRYHPGVERMGEIVRGGELGPAAGLRTLRLSRGLAHDAVDAVWVLAPHELAIGLEVLGHELKPRAALAVRRDGRVLQMLAMLGDDPWQAFEISSISAGHERAIELICRDGTASLPSPYADHLLVSRHDDLANEPERIPISTELPLLREVRAFVDYVRGEGPAPRSSASEGLWNVETIQRLRDLVAVDG
jgi:predicted dehydrogenase